MNSLKRRVIVIVKSHRASRRIRPPCCLTTLLSRATASATSQLFHPALFRSFLTVLLQVVFGLPLALWPLGVHPNAVKQSFPPSLLSMRLSQFHFLRRTSQLMLLISEKMRVQSHKSTMYGVFNHPRISCFFYRIKKLHVCHNNLVIRCSLFLCSCTYSLEFLCSRY